MGKLFAIVKLGVVGWGVEGLVVRSIELTTSVNTNERFDDIERCFKSGEKLFTGL